MANRNTIATLTSRKTINLKSGSGYTAQSLALVTAGSRYVFCNTHGSDSSGNHILKVSAKSYSVESAKIYTGHANGGTYCNKNDCFYTTSYGGGSANKKIKCWTRNYKLRFTVTLPVYATGIAYDPITTDFYVSVGDYFYVFPYSAFAKGGTYKGKYNSFKKKFTDYQNQDIGGFNGVIMCCKSWDINHSSNAYYTSYIDCYRARDGHYYGSYKTQGECESVAVDAGGNIHVLYAGHGGRRLVLMNQNIYKGITSIKKTAVEAGTSTITVKKLTESQLRNKIVRKAKSYKGSKGNHFWDHYGMNPDNWCAAFVWTVYDECGMGDIMKKTAYVPTMRDWLKQNGTARTTKTAKPGDIAIFGGGEHVEIVSVVESGGRILTIGGNTGYSEGATSFRNSTVSSSRYYGATPTSIFSPNFSKTKARITTADDVEGDSSTIIIENRLEVHADKLYSSDNYDYLVEQERAYENVISNTSKQAVLNLFNSADGLNLTVNDSPRTIGVLTGNVSGSAKLPRTKVDGEVHGPSLPTALNPIEAPFVELTIGGYTFGVKSRDDAYPNYISGLNVTRTNGSMNEYTINLTHQVSPGRNPNFIDELLAKNSYEKIRIKFGDANSNVIFTDEDALLTGSTVNFDFASCNIKYTISATSSAMTMATHKQNFPAVVDKGSNIIKSLLADSSTGLGKAYPKMTNQTYVAKNNLIPTDDAVISIDAVANMNPISYINLVVSAMKSLSNDKSTFYLLLENEQFRVYEVEVGNAAYNAELYEVNINYPDDSQVFSFNDNVNYSWPLAYEYGGNVTDYSYLINNNGSVQTYPLDSSSMFKYTGQDNISDNWWKDVTEFPITATLECRGLLSPLLLMTYIKVNCLYYGSQRLTSGVYIVTGQQDTLTGSGYRSTLYLTRVAGPKQHITVDSRIVT